MEENVLLSKYTTFKLGGSAEYFAVVKTVEEMKEAVRFAKEKGLPFLVLGGGSNVLVSDKGFKGVVIQNGIKGIEWIEDSRVRVGAGENWDDFVAETVKLGLWGLENLSGIPGSVGGAPVQNIGAYGAEVKDSIVSVSAFDTETEETTDLAREDCGFGYRDSFFKKKDGKKYVITSVTFALSKKGVPNILYKDLSKIFNEEERKKKIDQLTPQDIRKAVLEIRKGKFPDLTKIGTAGSFFKNPVVTKEKFEEMRKQFPDIPGFPVTDQASMIKVPLAWILDNVLKRKGERIGNVGLYEKQPLVLVNFGGGSTVEVRTVAKKIMDEVKEKTGIEIEWEVQYIS